MRLSPQEPDHLAGKKTLKYNHNDDCKITNCDKCYEVKRAESVEGAVGALGQQRV